MAVDVPEVIDINDLTKNGQIVEVDGELTWSGDGVFDKVIDTINKNLKIQYDEGRIRDVEYANAYITSIESSLARSIDYILRVKPINEELRLISNKT